MPGSFRVTLRKSPISYTARARGTLRALGLHRIGQTVEVVDNPQTRGMARAVRFLVEVEENEGGAVSQPAGSNARDSNRAAETGRATARTAREPVATADDAAKKPDRARAPRRSRTDEAS